MVKCKVEKMKRRNKAKSASSLVFVIFFLAIFLAFTAFAVDGTIVLTNRAKLQNATEMTALTAASEFNYSSLASATDIENKVLSSADDTFSLLKGDSLQTAQMIAQVKGKKVLVTTKMLSQTFFLSFLGVSGIELEANACAESEELNVTANYSNINWVSSSAIYMSDILSKDLNMNDTAILLPLGGFKSAGYDFESTFVKFDLIDSDDDNPLSLGPGGFITIKLPTPIIDKPGNDLYIEESGDALEGYFVFAGLDNNPAKPYVQKDNEGDGISWVNISCSGTPKKSDSGNLLGAYSVATDGLGAQTKFYGSAYFDLGDACVGGISMAKYIRIVDDNSESAFVDDSGNFNKVMFYGEASSATSGVDIDQVKVLNHVKLVEASSF